MKKTLFLLVACFLLVGMLLPSVLAGSLWGNTNDGKSPYVHGSGYYGRGTASGTTNQGKSFSAYYGQGDFVVSYRGRSYSGTYSGGSFSGSGHGRSFDGYYSTSARAKK